MKKRLSPQAGLQFESLETRRLMAADVVEREFNDRQTSANIFELPTTGSVALVGQSRSHNDKDFFLFQAPVSGKVNVAVTTTGAAAQAEVEDRFGNDLFETEPNDGVNSGAFSIEAGKWYFVRMRSVSSAAADYRAELSLDSVAPAPPANDPGTPDSPPSAPSEPGNVLNELENNNERRLANAFDLGSDGLISLRGSSDKEDRDFFVFTPASSGKLSLEVQSPSGRAAKLTLQDAQERDLFETEPNDGIHSGSVQVQAGQRYFIRIRGIRLTSDYQVNLKLEPAGSSTAAPATATSGSAVDTRQEDRQDDRRDDRQEDRQDDRQEDRQEDRRDRAEFIAARDALFAQIGSRRGRR